MAVKADGNIRKALDAYGHLLAIGLLIALTLVVFWHAFGFGFINLDDPDYVTNNPYVQTGLSLDSLRWAFHSLDQVTWQPLVWISYMLDWQLYGLNPTGYHLTNLLLHLLNVLLLFTLLRRMTSRPGSTQAGSIWKSAFVAALFAIHPLHVESVVWITERKDVLSTFFWMLALLAYVSYTEKPGVVRYAAIVIAFALGLMAKPMLVTLPFGLLLLDYWPLGRFSRMKPINLIWEKMPLFLISAGSVMAFYRVHETSGSLSTLSLYPLGVRIANALVSYASYILKTFWPARLAAFYPYPASGPPVWQIIASGAMLAGISILVIKARSKRPNLPMGWLWYLGTLLPTIGLIQTGRNAAADRFTYVPLIGLFIMIAWGVPKLRGGEGAMGRRGEKAVASMAAAAVLVLAVCARAQVGYWRDSRTLFEHALAVTKNNYVAEFCLGRVDQSEGNIDGAIAHFSAVLSTRPRDGMTHYNLAIALVQRGKLDEAIAHYKKAIELKPEFADAYNNLGIALGKQHRFSEEAEAYRSALAIAPDFLEARNNLAVSLYYARDYAGAWREVDFNRKYGFNAHPQFVKELASKMPEPGRSSK